MDIVDSDAATDDSTRVDAVAAQLALDFDGTCLLLANELASSAAPIPLLTLISQLTAALDASDDDDDDDRDDNDNAINEHSRRRLLSDDLVERFESEFVPQVVQLVLARPFERADVSAANRFLQFMLVCAKQKLLTGDPCLLPSLIRIFDDQRPFYIYHGVTRYNVRGSDEIEGNDGDADMEPDHDSDAPQFAVAMQTPGISTWFLQNVQFWGAIGGFALFLNSLRSMTRDDDGSVDTVLSYEAMQCVLRTVYAVKDALASQFLAAYVAPLCDAVRFFVKTVAPSEFYALPRDALVETVQVLELVLATVSETRDESVTPDDDVDVMRESLARVQLEMFARQLRSRALERRIHGLSEVVALVTRLFNTLVQTLVQPTVSQLQRKLAFVVRALHDHNVLHEVFGVATRHAELIKRSLPLFQFASELELLDPSWLDLVWDCYGGSSSAHNAAHRAVVHDLLLELVACVDASLLHVLLHKLQAVAAPDAEHLALFAAIAARTITEPSGEIDSVGDCVDEQSPRGLRAVVLSHLWRVAVSSAASDDAADLILEQMEQIVRCSLSDINDSDNEQGASVADIQLVRSFLQTCVANVASTQHVLVSLQWFTRLALLAAECAWRVTPLATDATHGTVSDVLLANLSNASMTETSASHRLRERKAQLLALRAAWILESSRIDDAQSAAQLDVVWRLVIDAARTAGDAALGFEWLEFCVNSSMLCADSMQVPLLSEALVEHVLIHHFGGLRADRMTRAALCCFDSLFRHLNLLRHGLVTYVIDDGSDACVCVATGEPLVGLEQLWRFAVQSVAADVAEECSTLLAALYLEFTPSLRDTDVLPRQHLAFVDTCMRFLVAAKTRVEQIRYSDDPGVDCDTVDDDNSSAVVNRCLDLLRFFLDACDATADASSPMQQRSAEDAVDTTNVNASCESSSDMSGCSGRAAFALETLEERLQHLDIYPSPMVKELHAVTTSPIDSTSANARRPSWSFRHHHALLDAIPDDDGESDDSERDAPSIALQTVSAASPLRTSNSMLQLPARPAITSPTLRVRPKLEWPQDASPLRGPELSVEDLSHALHEAATSRPHATDADTVEYTVTPAASKYSIASQLLANGATYFDALLALVDWRDATSQRAWELLCRLPTNNALLRTMIRLRPADTTDDPVVWLDQLPTGNTHRLLYALRLVEAMLLPTEAPCDVDTVGHDDGCCSTTNSTDAARRQWRERFVRLGGAQHLYTALLQWPAHQRNGVSTYAMNVTATCGAALMRTLRYFLELHRRSSEHSQQQRLDAFDMRLYTSTLPAFVHAISLLGLAESAVCLTFADASSRQSDAALSMQTEEAIQCGVQLFSAAVALQPSVLLGAFRDAADPKGDVCADVHQPSLAAWIACLLVECTSPTARSTALASLVALTADAPMCASRSRFVEQLVRELSEQATDDSTPYGACVQLVAFLDSLLSASVPRLEPSTRDAVVSWLAVNAVPQRLLLRLHAFVVNTAHISGLSYSNADDDNVVSSYVQVLTSLVCASETLRDSALQFRPSDDSGSDTRAAPLWTIDFVLTHLLFGDARVSSTADATVVLPVCASDRSRERAHALLFALIARPSCSDTLPLAATEHSTAAVAVHQILTHHRAFQTSVLASLQARGRPWRFSPRDLLQDVTTGVAHAGLVNPGCICYMNALVQQLFMAPAFRDGLLATACDDPSVTSESEYADEVAQLQLLFAALTATRFKALDPTPFALSHRDVDGYATDLRVQMDADEFFCLLLDRIDTCLTTMARRSDSRSDSIKQESIEDALPQPSTDRTSFLDACFGGVLVHQIITEHGHVSERDEKFFALSLDVSKKQQATLSDSLALYVAGEALDGANAYYCERVQRKVAATKRICIKTLPQTLVCHLKRFEFDFDAMEKRKLNDRLEFPLALDMAPFTSEALATTTGSSSMVVPTCMYDLVGVVVHSGTADMGHYYSFIKDRTSTSSDSKSQWLEFNDEVVQAFDADRIGTECFGGDEFEREWGSSHARTRRLQMKRRSAYMLLYERRESVMSSSSRPTPVLSPAAAARVASAQHENAQFQRVVDAFDTSYSAFLTALVQHARALPTTMSDRLPQRYSSDAVDAELLPGSHSTAVDAATLACQYVFGIAPLQSPEAVEQCATTQRELLTRVLAWLEAARDDPETDSDDDQQRCAFSTWLLHHAVTSSTPTTATSAVPQRSWLFDVVYLSEGSNEVVDASLDVLAAAAVVLTRAFVSTDDDVDGNSVATESCTAVVAFYRALLDLFYDRDESNELVDPTTGGAATLSRATTVTALLRIGALLERCVCVSFADAPSERAATHTLVADRLQFADRLLFSLQTEWRDSVDCDSVGGGDASSTVSVPQLRACTLAVERRLLAALSDSLCHTPLHNASYNCGIAVDASLVLNQTALTNILQCGFERPFAPVLARLVLHGSAAQRDQLIGLLLAVLEDVKATALVPSMLELLASLLDAEERNVGSDSVVVGSIDIDDGTVAPVHRHVLSPVHGVLEAAAYYRDNPALHHYAFVLLEFVVLRARDSPLLRALFAADAALRTQTTWIATWLTHRVDPTGSVRARRLTHADGKTAVTSDGDDTAALLDAIAIAFSDCSDDQQQQQQQQQVAACASARPGDSALTLDDIVAELVESPSKANKQSRHDGPEADDSSDDDDDSAQTNAVRRAAPVRRERASRAAKVKSAHTATPSTRDAMYYNRSEA